ncbi:MAG: amidohydrolase family protein [Anaerolineae bacterium]
MSTAAAEKGMAGAAGLLIRDGVVLGPQGWWNPGHVYVEDGLVRQAGAGAPPPALVETAGRVLSARGRAVLPGVINAHTHFSQTLMRGLAGGRPLVQWLKELIWPLQNTLTPQEMYLAALLGLVENLHNGVTQVIQHHKVVRGAEFTDAVCRAAREVGLRMTLARSWADMGANPEPAEAILEDFQRLYREWHQPGRLEIANGPISTWRCSEATMQKTHALAGEHGAPTHIHVAESQDEVRMTRELFGRRPVEWLDGIGVLDQRTQVVHAVWLEESEKQLLAERGATVVHCPVSNMVLGSGIAPVADLLRRGVRVLLGTDGPASNDTQDIWETLKTAVGLARVASLDPTLLPPAQALRLITDGRVLAEGAPADIILVRWSHVRAAPVHDLDSALVLSTHGCDVETVIADGRILMEAGRVLVLDEPALLEEAETALRHLRRRLGWE